jgi:hypothetical protein
MRGVEGEVAANYSGLFAQEGWGIVCKSVGGSCESFLRVSCVRVG